MSYFNNYLQAVSVDKILFAVFMAGQAAMRFQSSGSDRMVRRMEVGQAVIQHWPAPRGFS